MQIQGVSLGRFFLNYLAAFRRFGKDSRARRMVLQGTVLFLLIPVYYGVLSLFVIKEGHWSAFLAYAALGAGAWVVFRLVRRGQREQDELFSHSLVAAPMAIEPDVVLPELRRGLTQRLHLSAWLLVRAFSEARIALGEKVEPAQRQGVNSYLRTHGLWESLEPDERELLSRPEGSWPDEAIGRIPEWLAQLRLLRFAFGLDEELAVPTGQLGGGDSLLSGLDDASAPMLRALRPVWDVREQRNITTGYRDRVVAELVVRGLADSETNTLLQSWAKRRVADQNPSTDLMAGSCTVGELAEEDLLRLDAIVRARLEYSTYLVDVLSDGLWLSLVEWRRRCEEEARLAEESSDEEEECDEEDS